MKKTVFILLFLFVSKLFAQEFPIARKVKYPVEYNAKIDEVYTTVDGWNGKEDIYYNPLALKPTPIVFNIHGGGWNHGSKESQAGFGGFFSLGYAVANVEYRLSSVATAPAAIEDVRSAILYVVKHAKELNINPNQIVVMGSSAGAHLALMAGLLQNDHRFDANYKNVDGFTIAAIIDQYGPTDLTVPGIENNKSAAAWLGNYWGNKELMASVSPIYYVKKTSPPIFIVHGDADPTVPYQQSVALHNKLEELGVKSKFITVPGGKHGGFGDKQKEILEQGREFLGEIIK